MTTMVDIWKEERVNKISRDPFVIRLKRLVAVCVGEPEMSWKSPTPYKLNGFY